MVPIETICSILKLVRVPNAAPNFIKGLAMPQAECRRNKKQEIFLARTCPLLTVIHCKAEWRYSWMVRSFFTVRTFCETDPDSAENSTKPQKTKLCDVSMFPCQRAYHQAQAAAAQATQLSNVSSRFDSTYDVKCSDLRCGSRSVLSTTRSARTLASLQAEVLNAYEAAIVRYRSTLQP